MINTSSSSDHKPKHYHLQPTSGFQDEPYLDYIANDGILDRNKVFEEDLFAPSMFCICRKSTFMRLGSYTEILTVKMRTAS